MNYYYILVSLPSFVFLFFFFSTLFFVVYIVNEWGNFWLWLPLLLLLVLHIPLPLLQRSLPFINQLTLYWSFTRPSFFILRSEYCLLSWISSYNFTSCKLPMKSSDGISRCKRISKNIVSRFLLCAASLWKRNLNCIPIWRWRVTGDGKSTQLNSCTHYADHIPYKTLCSVGNKPNQWWCDVVEEEKAWRSSFSVGWPGLSTLLCSGWLHLAVYLGVTARCCWAKGTLNLINTVLRVISNRQERRKLQINTVIKILLLDGWMAVGGAM